MEASAIQQSQNVFFIDLHRSPDYEFWIEKISEVFNTNIVPIQKERERLLQKFNKNENCEAYVAHTEEKQICGMFVMNKNMHLAYGRWKKSLEVKCLIFTKLDSATCIISKMQEIAIKAGAQYFYAIVTGGYRSNLEKHGFVEVATLHSLYHNYTRFVMMFDVEHASGRALTS